jgi:hypothetical protein
MSESVSPMKTFLVLSILLTCTATTRADVLGSTLPELTLGDGTRLFQVRFLRASASAKTLTISSNRMLRTIPLQQLPDDLRRQVLLECGRDDYRREWNVVRSPAPSVRTTDASAPVPRSESSASSSAEPTFSDLRQQAAKLAPDELLMHLQKTHQRVSGLDCIIRTNEKISGWQQIRVTGTASFSMWDNYVRDYVRRVARFEVEFEIINGEQLRANSVTFGGIAGRIDP